MYTYKHVQIALDRSSERWSLSQTTCTSPKPKPSISTQKNEAKLPNLPKVIHIE
jgi:hypothetical protein